jgi:hypothetical protein
VPGFWRVLSQNYLIEVSSDDPHWTASLQLQRPRPWVPCVSSLPRAPFATSWMPILGLHWDCIGIIDEEQRSSLHNGSRSLRLPLSHQRVDYPLGAIGHCDSILERMPIIDQRPRGGLVAPPFQSGFGSQLGYIRTQHPVSTAKQTGQENEMEEDTRLLCIMRFRPEDLDDFGSIWGHVGKRPGVHASLSMDCIPRTGLHACRRPPYATYVSSQHHQHWEQTAHTVRQQTPISESVRSSPGSLSLLAD